MHLSGTWLSLVSVINFGVRVSLKAFASALALVRGLLGLLVSILVFVLVPGLMKGPLLFLFGLIGAPGFVTQSSGLVSL